VGTVVSPLYLNAVDVSDADDHNVAAWPFSVIAQTNTPHCGKERVMKVAEVMNHRIVKVGPRTTLREILQLLLRSHLNDILVVNNKDKLLGIVTHGDLSRRLLPSELELAEHEEYITNPEMMEDRFIDILGLPVEGIMTKNVITVPPDCNAIKAGAIMLARKVKQLPVVEAQKVVGIISYTDIGWSLMMKYSESMKS
jgi:CBS domain-containing protein